MPRRTIKPEVSEVFFFSFLMRIKIKDKQKHLRHFPPFSISPNAPSHLFLSVFKKKRGAAGFRKDKAKTRQLPSSVSWLSRPAARRVNPKCCLWLVHLHSGLEKGHGKALTSHSNSAIDGPQIPMW